MTPCNSTDVVLTGKKQCYRKEHRVSCGSVSASGVEEHTGHGNPFKEGSYSLLFRACETASGAMCPVLCSLIQGRC